MSCTAVLACPALSRPICPTPPCLPHPALPSFCLVRACHFTTLQGPLSPHPSYWPLPGRRRPLPFVFAASRLAPLAGAAATAAIWLFHKPLRTHYLLHHTWALQCCLPLAYATPLAGAEASAVSRHAHLCPWLTSCSWSVPHRRPFLCFCYPPTLLLWPLQIWLGGKPELQ